jgi:hypothetical protein
VLRLAVEWATLPAAVRLGAPAHNRYYLVSSEQRAGDVFYDRNAQVQAARGLTLGWPLPVYCDEATGCHDEGLEATSPPWPTCFGPVNMMWHTME